MTLQGHIAVARAALIDAGAVISGPVIDHLEVVSTALAKEYLALMHASRRGASEPIVHDVLGQELSDLAETVH